MTAIENVKAWKEGMRLSLSTTVERENIGEVLQMVEFVKSTRLYGIHFQPIMPATLPPTYARHGNFKKIPLGTPYKNRLKKEEIVTDEEIDDVFGRLVAMA